MWCFYFYYCDAIDIRYLVIKNFINNNNNEIQKTLRRRNVLVILLQMMVMNRDPESRAWSTQRSRQHNLYFSIALARDGSKGYHLHCAGTWKWGLFLHRVFFFFYRRINYNIIRLHCRNMATGRNVVMPSLGNYCFYHQNISNSCAEKSYHFTVTFVISPYAVCATVKRCRCTRKDYIRLVIIIKHVWE